ncbi:cold shock CspA family protein [Bradyrhizobium sp. CIR48]|uniref:cold-shock protein n=1 Tax=Bradyrhizobium sp. CIR48 TaxID=2663840 RepID=UPI0017FB5969|nr:cold shock domain-containing protein [Bradyrhizobium sp. CIR48]MBB4422307.1 cold shock CspA family protein [Bradyrhizobium sp. CIR48]
MDERLSNSFGSLQPDEAVPMSVGTPPDGRAGWPNFGHPANLEERAERDVVMPTGTCTGWNEPKGFGFVRLDGPRSADLFVHRTNLRGSALWLEQGQRVEFEVGLDNRTGKQQALNVRLI